MRFFIACLFAFPLVVIGLPLSGEAAVTPESGPVGAVVTITGKGFGPFRSAHDSRVSFKGAPALIQRWEPDLIVVKVPLRAADGPVEVVRGKKRIPVGSFSVQ